MATSFNISFSYKGQSYEASISKSDGSTTIFFPDMALQSIVPAGRISFDSDKGLPVDALPLTPAQDLVIAVLCAIEAKDQEVEGNSREIQ